MAAIIVDPSEMRKFEAALRELSGEVQARRLDLQNRTSEASRFWNDEKYRDFVRRQEELMLEIQAFTNLCERYCDYLRRKAGAAEAYLGR